MNYEISGDTRLRAKQRAQYLWRNALRNIKLSSNEFTAHKWSLPKAAYDTWAVGKPSPLRVLSEAFLALELPALIGKTEINILDIGCGSGRSLDLLIQAGFKGNYIGLDIDDRFAPSVKAHETFNISFTRQDVHSGLPKGPFDLIVSNSALEHIPNDHKLAQIFDAALSDTGVQLHIVPAPGGLFTYLWHGYRQYPLSAIADRFDPRGTTIIALGGLFSFLTHLFLITIPEILMHVSLRNKAQVLYQTCLRTALRLDCYAPFPAVGYVIISHKS